MWFIYIVALSSRTHINTYYYYYYYQLHASHYLFIDINNKHQDEISPAPSVPRDYCHISDSPPQLMHSNPPFASASCTIINNSQNPELYATFMPLVKLIMASWKTAADEQCNFLILRFARLPHRLSDDNDENNENGEQHKYTTYRHRHHGVCSTHHRVYTAAKLRLMRGSVISPHPRPLFGRHQRP